jgi:hypothetical protein
MTDGIFKEPVIAPSITCAPVGRCIYCGSRERLTNEHIIPLSLNGTMILPESSCRVCAGITSKFELTVARQMYGVLRNKRGYNTRRKKERLTSLSLSYSSSGVIKSIDLDLVDYPYTYLIPFLPPPGMLTGASLSDFNPELKLELMGNPNEIARIASVIGGENIHVFMRSSFAWGDFCRLLAKIAHGYLIAAYGQEGYVSFLPDLILGHSSHLGHYIIGGDGDEVRYMPGAHLGWGTLIVDDACYLAVYIHLLGGVTMPTYQVVAAKVTDFTLLTEIIRSSNAE